MREFVRQRARERCEYCRLPEASAPYIVFHVDHIIAKQHVDEPSDAPNRLAWACSVCNYHKGPNLSSIDPETRQQVNLFDPRNDSWNMHFSQAGGVIVGLTARGRATARLLNMNSPRMVRIRKELIRLGEF